MIVYVIAYVIGWPLSFFVFARMIDDDDATGTALAATLWPVSIPCALFSGLIYVVVTLFELIGPSLEGLQNWCKEVGKK